jgi:hypothetical protein
MIKNSSLATFVAAAIALVAGLIAYTILGIASTAVIVIEFVVVLVTFVIMNWVLPLSPAELANNQAILQLRELKQNIQSSIDNINNMLKFYNVDGDIYNQVKEIIRVSVKIVTDLSKPGKSDLTKLVKLDEFLSDFAICLRYYCQIKSHELMVSDRKGEIKSFEIDLLPATVDGFITFTERSDQSEVLMARSRAQILKTKMAMDGLRASTVDTLKEFDR